LGWSEQKKKNNFSKMAAKYKEKRMAIATVPDQYLSFATLPTSLVSHWSLPLM